MDCSTPGFPVLHHLLELAQTHVHRVDEMPFNHLILCHPLLLLPSIFPSIRVFWRCSLNHWTVWKCLSCAQSVSCVWLFATLWTVAHQAFLYMGFYRQEYWSGLPCPPLGGGLPDPEMEPTAPALAGRLFTTEPPGKPWKSIKPSSHCDRKKRCTS